jgi:hypothetical protein
MPLQQARFSLLQQREARFIRRHGTDPDSWHERGIITLVRRLPDELAPELVTAVQSLGLGEFGDYMYPATDLHMTVLNLDAAARTLRSGELSHRLSRVMLNEPVRTIHIRGLAVSRHTVFAKVYSSPSLGPLRRRMRAALGHPYRPPHPADAIAFVNLIRFKTVQGVTVIDAVRDRAHAPFGRFVLDHVEMVHTDKVFSAAGTKFLGRIPMT